MKVKPKSLFRLLKEELKGMDIPDRFKAGLKRLREHERKIRNERY